jgi:RHS repeat-associated protein
VVLNPDGRAVWNSSTSKWEYEYDVKDHLGNTRASFAPTTDKVKVLQTRDYYPFGLEMANWYLNDANATKFRYNGKELQDEELAGNSLGWYDYGARFYDPQLGRWHVLDPLAQLFYSWSPYNYAYNSPVRYIDPDGSIPWDKVINFTSITSNFGYRIHPTKGTKDFHVGIDLGASTGSEVRSLAAGKVVMAKWDKGDKTGKTGYGKYIVIDHGHGYYSLYGHLHGSGLKVGEGDDVTNGQVIALSGNTGRSTGPHLHLEMAKAGSLGAFFNPASKLDPKSIKDLQILIDQLNGVVFGEENNNIYLGKEIEEVTVTAKGPERPKPKEVRIENIMLQGAKTNANGNTGKYNKPGRSTDQYYSDEFLKWYYGY